MSTTSDALVIVRDAAHLNQHALGLVADEAQAAFYSIRGWDDSPTKQSILKVLGSTIIGYRNAQTQAVSLRDAAANELAAIGGVVPDLPPTDGSVQWSQQDW